MLVLSLYIRKKEMFLLLLLLFKNAHNGNFYIDGTMLKKTRFDFLKQTPST